MKHVGIFEAKTHLSSLLDEVEKGGEVTNHAARQAGGETCSHDRGAVRGCDSTTTRGHRKASRQGQGAWRDGVSRRNQVLDRGWPALIVVDAALTIAHVLSENRQWPIARHQAAANPSNVKVV
jgi:hypothetical protein